LRDRLIAEVRELGSSDKAATWAHKKLAEKNKLTAADSRAVEDAFQAKLETFVLRSTPASESAENTSSGGTSRNRRATKPKHGGRTRAIDKRVLAMPEPRRVRDRDHVQSVARHPCLVCGRRPADAHHLRFAQGKALGRKVSDEFTVPLCRGHHREVHRRGDEAAWWRNTGVDPTVAARSFWLESHPLPIGQEEPTSNSRVQAGP
jgi:hypothetical protein